MWSWGKDGRYRQAQPEETPMHRLQVHLRIAVKVLEINLTLTLNTVTRREIVLRHMDNVRRRKAEGRAV